MIVADCETDGLVEEATKIHVFSYTFNGIDYHSLHDREHIKALLQQQDWIVIHNGQRFDARIFQKLLGIDVSNKIIDTLPLSWYLNPDRVIHGLESFGEEFGIPKPEIKDWISLTPADYEHRCVEDVKINWALWKNLTDKLMKLYGDKAEAFRLMKYLSFKMKCAAIQETVKWRVDLSRVQKNINELTDLQSGKVEELKKFMPLVPRYKTKTKPKNIFKKDGSLSAHGEKWVELVRNEVPITNIPPDIYDMPIEVLDKMEEPNPNSPEQVKDWLTSLGWVPCTFKYVKEENGKLREIPQVRKDGELAPSVLRLAEKNESVKTLEDLSVIQSRLGVFTNFLELSVDGFLEAGVGGLTNTLRFKHKNPLVNLPGVDKPWGEEIRACLIAPDDNHVLFGVDMVSLESTTKRHYMFPLDPKYVEEMSQPGFDEHLDLAVKANYLDSVDYTFYTTTDEKTTSEKDRFTKIKAIRKKFKPVNYSAIYGVGEAKLARETGMTKAEAKKLLEAYWKRNWAVAKVSAVLKTKEAIGHKWLFNPVSKFWYSLREEKDKFSTLNQGTGAYCFDTWLAYVTSKGVKTCGQFHDEVIAPSRLEHCGKTNQIFQWAKEQLNKKLKLNVELDINVQFGNNYAEIH